MKVTMRPATKLPQIIMHTDSCGFTILRIAPPQLWTLPRAKNCSTVRNFCPASGCAALSSPFRRTKKEDAVRHPLFWLKWA